MRKPNTYNQILSVLQELHKLYPTYNVGRHLSMALGDYGDLWGVSDKEVLFALDKYKVQLEIDGNPYTEEDVSDIIRDGMNLGTVFTEEEEEEEEGY